MIEPAIPPENSEVDIYAIDIWLILQLLILNSSAKKLPTILKEIHTHSKQGICPICEGGIAICVDGNGVQVEDTSHPSFYGFQMQHNPGCPLHILENRVRHIENTKKMNHRTLKRLYPENNER